MIQRAQPEPDFVGLLEREEQLGRQLKAASERVWAGERDADLLTRDVDPSSARMIRRILEMIERPEDDSPTLDAVAGMLGLDATDPAARALHALLQIQDDDDYDRVVKQHPILLNLATLERLGAAIETHAGEKPADASVLLMWLTNLIGSRLGRPEEDIVLADHEKLLLLHERVLPLAGRLGEKDTEAALRRTLAYTHAQLGDHWLGGEDDASRACEQFQHAIAIAPDEADFHLGLARANIQRDAFDKARANIEAAAALSPDAPELLLLECHTYAGLGLADPLEASAARMVERDGADASGPVFQAIARVYRGALAAAIDCVGDRAASRDEGHHAWAASFVDELARLHPQWADDLKKLARAIRGQET